MSVAREIPLIASAQKFFITLVGVQYQFTLHWCDPAQCWILDIGDLNGVPMIQGIALVTGADLVQQFHYLGITGQLIVQTDNNPTAVPTFTNLGTTGHLYFVSDN